MSDEFHHLWAPFVWGDEGWLLGAAVTLERGMITAVRAGPCPAGALDLGHVALVPGQVNAHSHAFQRLIRGRTEYGQAGRLEEDFWSWRHQMYEVALRLDAHQLWEAARQVFWEMLLCGITTVGEFHYLHHQPDGAPYADPNELGHVVIKAAREVGIRIVLLRVAYERAGWGKPADQMQRRFVEPDVQTYLARAHELARVWQGVAGVSVGVAPHSIRAVSAPWLDAIMKGRMPGSVVHIHANEQREEVAQSMAEYGERPIEVLGRLGVLGPSTTLVHATHLSQEELGWIAASGSRVCACPSTERNLGDGFLPAKALVERGVEICLGSDSHTMIDPWEEMRLVEYHERLRFERRNVLISPHDTGQRREPASVLWRMGGEHGGRSVGVRVGRIKEGWGGDLVALDLGHPSLWGADEESLSSTIVFSAKPGAVRHVWACGRWCVREGEQVGGEK